MFLALDLNEVSMVVNPSHSKSLHVINNSNILVMWPYDLVATQAAFSAPAVPEL